MYPSYGIHSGLLICLSSLISSIVYSSFVYLHCYSSIEALEHRLYRCASMCFLLFELLTLFEAAGKYDVRHLCVPTYIQHIVSVKCLHVTGVFIFFCLYLSEAHSLLLKAVNSEMYEIKKMYVYIVRQWSRMCVSFFVRQFLCVYPS